MAKETTLAGWAFGLAKRNAPAGDPNTWELILLDATVGPDGAPVPGSGSLELVRVLMDDDAVRALHEQSSGLSPVAVPNPPRLVVPQMSTERPGARGRR